MLVKGAESYGEPGVYVTLTDTSEGFKRDALSFGWDLESLEKKGTFALLDLRPSRFLEARAEEVAESFFAWVLRSLLLKAREIGAKRVAIDSINVLSGQFQDEYQARQAIMSLVETLQKLPDSVSFLVFEQITMERTREEFLTSGVIILHYVPVKNGMMRAVQILKMRRTDHSENFHPFEITSKGIRIDSKKTVVFF